MRYAVRVGRTVFANPVLAASGTFGFGIEFRRVANRIGGVVTKAVTLKPRDGNPPPRIFEFPGGILNSVGLENPGLQEFRKRVVPEFAGLRCRVIVNVAGFTVREFEAIVAGLGHRAVSGFELNLSCPNVARAGVGFGQSPRAVERITRAVRKRTRKTLFVKLTANFVDPLGTARAAEQGGADAVTLVNTLFGLALDGSGRPFLGGRTGGMSGPALKPFALFCVDRVAPRVRIPVVGCGGIMSGQDALDFMSAGASLVQVGTANLVDPEATLRVWQELRMLCRQHRIGSWAGLVGRTRSQD